jgi:hypothetical protein
MSRLVSCGFTLVSLSLITLCLGCGGGTKTTTDQEVTPAIVTLTPTADVSLEIGGTASFSSVAQDAGGAPLSPSPLISFVSSNPNVVQVAASGLACAGKWDSLVNPQICAPGPVGTADVTAVSVGVSSPPVTVHVHQHIDSIAISPVPGQTQSTDFCKLGSVYPGVIGLSKTQTFNFQATAYNRGSGPAPGVDITNTVGPFTWSTLNSPPSILSLNPAARGLQAGQVQVTANNPGMTSIFASVGGSNSPPVQIMTCPVKSISLALQNTSQTSFTVDSGSQVVTPTVTDSSDTEITLTNLQWSTSNAAAFTALAGTVSSVTPGSATVIASCTPPGCNAGFPTPLAIYPQNVITATATGAGATTAPARTVFLASTECGIPDPVTQVVTNNDNCINTILPIDANTGVSGASADLPVRPDSLVFNRQSSKAFLGTDSGRLGTVGLSIVTPGSSTQVAPTILALPSAPGNVLAISPDGDKVIVSDTADSPNQVFVVAGATGTSPAASPLSISGATAASFAPDSSKAYIVAGTSVYIYSPNESLKKITLAGTGTDVAFLANGAFAYIASNSASPQITTRKTCDHDVARDSTGAVQDVSLPGVPQFIRPLADASGLIALRSPGISLISVDSSPVDCKAPSASAPGGLPTVQNGAVSSFNLGVGTFTPKQFILSGDGKRAYIVATDVTNIVVFNVDSLTTSTVQLAGSSIPIQAFLTTDGKILYVLAKDTSTGVNSVHVVDTGIYTDANQFVPSQNLCHPRANTVGTYTCAADLIAVKP